MRHVMVLQRSAVYDSVAVALVGQSSVIHNKAVECNMEDNFPNPNFNFPDVEAVAFSSPGRVCLAVSPRVTAMTHNIRP